MNDLEKIKIGEYKGSSVFYNSKNGEVYTLWAHNILGTSRSRIGSMPVGLSKEEAKQDFKNWKENKND